MFGEASQLDLTFPLESAQDLVKKMEQGNWGETLTILQKHPEEISKLQAEFSNIPHAYYKPPFINYLNTGLGDKTREDIWQDAG